MWTWYECEDFDSATGDVRVVDDWGAAAMRRIDVPMQGIVTYRLPLQSEMPDRLAIRYSYSGSGVGSRASALLLIDTSDFPGCRVELESGPGWRWAQAEGVPLSGAVSFAFLGSGTCLLDGFFLHDGSAPLLEHAHDLDAFLGEVEARGIPHLTAPRYDLTGIAPLVLGSGAVLPSDVLSGFGESRAVFDSLAAKPCPYIVNTYDTGKGTDYSSDYSWHLLDKEKRWELPGSAMLGVVNPNSDVHLIVGLGWEQAGISCRLMHRPILHLANLIAYEVNTDLPIRCEVVFECHSSDTMLVRVIASNEADAECRLATAVLHSADGRTNPPLQPYVLPGQKFGSGVTTTAGARGPTAVAGPRPGVSVWPEVFTEWVRGRSRGRRLLMTMATVGDPSFDVDIELADVIGGRLDGDLWGVYGLVVPPHGVASVVFAINMRRFTLQDTWNPEITPELFRKETEQEAVEAGYRACVEALSEDMEEAIRRSVEPCRTFPRVSLPVKSWEADFYACLELPRASTFSPTGAMKRPFYNFCRVHAHDPFGWWSYGMHAHEGLCTLFNNIVAPGLSAEFLRGHFDQQREDGMYPYGASPAIGPRLKTQEATAPLIVWEAWNCYLWSGDREFLQEAYESGKRNHEWWLRERDRTGDGLCHWLNTSWESVRDDNDLATWTATGGSENQAALDLNCYLLVQERTLAAMARELGPPSPQPSLRLRSGQAPAVGGEGDHFDALTRQREDAMNSRLWHDEDRLYYGVNEIEPGFARVKDISTFFPLWAKLAPEGRFERIVELVTDPETFGLPYGPPVLAANEPGFGPEAHWKGANWVEMSMFVISGLKNYGYYRLAANLAYQNTKMVFDELEKYGHFREYFNSMTGEGVDLIDYIWTAMPAYFIVNIFFGVEPRAEGLSILPALPDGWDHIEMENLHIRGKRVALSVRVGECMSATVNGTPAEVIENRGVMIPWDELADGDRVEIVQGRTV